MLSVKPLFHKFEKHHAWLFGIALVILLVAVLATMTNMLGVKKLEDFLEKKIYGQIGLGANTIALILLLVFAFVGKY